MAKLRRIRYRDLPTDDEHELPPVRRAYCAHMERKTYLALNQVYTQLTPKLTKAQRAARKRRLAGYAEPVVPTPRPDEQDPQWRGRKAKVLAVGRCAWCGATRHLTVDHIVPLAAGGSNALRNLQCLCRSCNRAKGSQTGIFPCPG